MSTYQISNIDLRENIFAKLTKILRLLDKIAIWRSNYTNAIETQHRSWPLLSVPLTGSLPSKVRVLNNSAGHAFFIQRQINTKHSCCRFNNFSRRYPGKFVNKWKLTSGPGRPAFPGAPYQRRNCNWIKWKFEAHWLKKVWKLAFIYLRSFLSECSRVTLK